MFMIVKHITAHPISRKCFSLVIGYALWSVLGNISTTTVSVTIPLSWYNMPQHINTLAPETLTVTIAGKRSHLRTLNTQMLALHVNGAQLQQGQNYLAIDRYNLFLPESIKLVHYEPFPLVVTTHEKST